MSHSKELFQIASQLDKYTDYETPELDALIEATVDVGKSWSGSWLDSKSRTYNKDFKPTSDIYGQESQEPKIYGYPPSPDWREYRFDDVKQHINEKAGNPSTDHFSDDNRDATTVFKKAKSSALSFVYENFDIEGDRFFQSWLDKMDDLEILTERDIIESQRPLNQQAPKNRTASKINPGFFRSSKKSKSNWEFLASFATKSQEYSPDVIKEDMKTPPHVVVLAETLATKHPFDSCKALKEQIVEMASHLQNIEKTLLKEGKIGTKVFIGHGRSHCWRELKDFISDSLKLPCDEFNCVPTAGLTIPERLEQMLDQAYIAFLVMTAEDEQADGTQPMPV